MMQKKPPSYKHLYRERLYLYYRHKTVYRHYIHRGRDKFAAEYDIFGTKPHRISYTDMRGVV